MWRRISLWPSVSMPIRAYATPESLRPKPIVSQWEKSDQFKRFTAKHPRSRTYEELWRQFRNRSFSGTAASAADNPDLLFRARLYLRFRDTIPRRLITQAVFEITPPRPLQLPIE